MGQDPDRTKLAELILHITDRGFDDPTLGKTKLAKLLYFIDTAAYLELGSSITGAAYIKYPRGPVPGDYFSVLESLMDSGALLKREWRMGTYRQERFIPLRDPDLANFGGEEIALVDCVIQQFSGLDAAMMSELSHADAGWQSTKLYEEIPYEAAFVSTDPPSEEAIRHGQEVAKRLGLLSE